MKTPKMTLEEATSDVDMEQADMSNAEQDEPEADPTTTCAKDAAPSANEGQGPHGAPTSENSDLGTGTGALDLAVTSAQTQGAVQAALRSGVIQEIILKRPESFQLKEMGLANVWWLSRVNLNSS